MYKILQARAKQHILKYMPERKLYTIFDNDDIPCIHYEGVYCISKYTKDDDLCYLFCDTKNISNRNNKKEQWCIKLVSQVFQIYGMDIEQTNNNYYYKDYMGNNNSLTLSIKYDNHKLFCYINEFPLNYQNDGVLLMLLLDPIKCIQLIHNPVQDPMAMCLFDTLTYNINYFRSAEYWLLMQVMKGFLVGDMQYTILDKYYALCAADKA